MRTAARAESAVTSKASRRPEAGSAGTGADGFFPGLVSAAFFSSSLFFAFAAGLAMQRAFPPLGFAAFALLAFFCLAAMGAIALREKAWVSSLTAVLLAAFLLGALSTRYFPSVALSAFLASLPFAWMGRAEGKTFPQSLSCLGFSRRSLAPDIALGVAATLFLLYPAIIMESLALRFLFGVTDLENVSSLLLESPPWVSAFAVAVAPIGEELFFRAFLLRKIVGFFGLFGLAGKDWFSSPPAVLAAAVAISSLAFMAAHYSYGSVAEFAGAFTIGAALALLYLRTRSVAVVIASHASFNLISVLAIHLAGMLPAGLAGLA